jgi:16S rRNA (adenine1518-N6/adenine1519-N6)-dimethyltransferase
MVRPKKHLGQHFLTDKNIAVKIVSCLSDDLHVVCELGPGTGVLTEPLLKKKSIEKLVLVEVDRESVEFLNTHFKDKRLQIVSADFLKLDLKQINATPFALIGNFPYNISSQILFKVLEHRNAIPEVVCMIQKEVAERIAAPPGSKTYGILSVLLQTWFDIHYCFTVNENVFFPPPKVKSGVIKLIRNEKTQIDCDEQLFFQVVKTAFNQRRKTLRNALKAKFSIKNPEDSLLNKRAEQLSVEQFVQLTKILEPVISS